MENKYFNTRRRNKICNYKQKMELINRRNSINEKYMNPDLRQQALDRIKECKLIANEKLKIELPPIRVYFDLRGNRAGVAGKIRNKDTRAVEWAMKINQDYLERFTEDMIEDTIPHEMAHIVADFYYNTRAAHGWQWRKIMWDVYKLTPYRTHTYGKALNGNKMRRYTIRCPHCRFQHHATARFREKVRGLEHQLSCRSCKKFFGPTVEFLLTTH